MGQTMGKALGARGGLNALGPPRIAEAIVALLVPPASREEVLGDLHERYRSPRQYVCEASRTVPLVIASRIRRTADAQVLMMQALALYLSFLSAARLIDSAVLSEPWGLLRLAIPAAMILLGLILEDAYARPGKRSPLGLARGPVLGIGLAVGSQAMLGLGGGDLAVAQRILVYGCAMSLLLGSAVRMLFPPVTDQLQGVHVPALWLKRESVSMGVPLRVIIIIASIVAAGLVLVVASRS
jgi:hypothetical protein